MQNHDSENSQIDDQRQRHVSPIGGCPAVLIALVTLFSLATVIALLLGWIGFLVKRIWAL